MLLEFRSILFGELLRVLCLSLIFIRNLFAVFVELFLLGRGLLRCDKEDLERCLVTSGVAIEDVASVLAVVLTETPPECFTHHLCWNLLVVRVTVEILVNLLLKAQKFKIVIRFCLIFGKLRELLLVDLLAIGSGSTAFFTFCGAFFSCLVLSVSLGLNFLFFLGFEFFIRSGVLSFLAALALCKTQFFLSFSLSSHGSLKLIVSALFLLSTLFSQHVKAEFLFLTMLPLSFFLLVPVLDVTEHRLLVDVRHSVVLSELSSEERLAAARLARDANFEWLQTALLAELILNELDVDRETTLAMPFKI